jgi:hypothetical protein
MSCRHLPRTRRVYLEEGGYRCSACGTVVTTEQQRKGRTVREYALRAELDAAHRYGGSKTNDGGPVDIEGRDWLTQMKTKRAAPPVMWVRSFNAMWGGGVRIPRLLLRYVQGPGKPPIDFFVVRGTDWINWFGRDA